MDEAPKVCIISLSHIIKEEDLSGSAEVVLDDNLPPTLENVFDKSTQVLFDEDESSRGYKYRSINVDDRSLLSFISCLRNHGWGLIGTNGLTLRGDAVKTFYFEKSIPPSKLRAASKPLSMRSSSVLSTKSIRKLGVADPLESSRGSISVETAPKPDIDNVEVPPKPTDKQAETPEVKPTVPAEKPALLQTTTPNMFKQLAQQRRKQGEKMEDAEKAVTISSTVGETPSVPPPPTKERTTSIGGEKSVGALKLMMGASLAGIGGPRPSSVRAQIIHDESGGLDGLTKGRPVNEKKRRPTGLKRSESLEAMKQNALITPLGDTSLPAEAASPSETVPAGSDSSPTAPVNAPPPPPVVKPPPPAPPTVKPPPPQPPNNASDAPPSIPAPQPPPAQPVSAPPVPATAPPAPAPPPAPAAPAQPVPVTTAANGGPPTAAAPPPTAAPPPPKPADEAVKDTPTPEKTTKEKNDEYFRKLKEEEVRERKERESNMSQEDLDKMREEEEERKSRDSAKVNHFSLLGKSFARAPRIGGGRGGRGSGSK